MSANETQVGGTHYQSSLQHWDIAAQYAGVGYHINCATKYLSRWQKKGTPKQDLEKAIHYIEKVRELVLAGASLPVPLDADVILQFANANELGYSERVALKQLWRCKSVTDLELAAICVHSILALVVNPAGHNLVTPSGFIMEVVAPAEPNHPGTPEDGGHHALYKG
jgi:hypothetical protein